MTSLHSTMGLVCSKDNTTSESNSSCTNDSANKDSANTSTKMYARAPMLAINPDEDINIPVAHVVLNILQVAPVIETKQQTKDRIRLIKNLATRETRADNSDAIFSKAMINIIYYDADKALKMKRK